MAKNQTHSSFYGSPCYLQDYGIPIQKMKFLEWSQYPFHCESMQNFPEAQGP